MVVVGDGDVIDAGGLKFTAIDTPGHARHHHVFRLEDIGFTGDAAGIHLADEDWVDLPAPPPEFDLLEWKASLKKIRDQNFSTIYRTHFGPATEVARQLEIFETQLEDAAKMVRQMVEAGLDRETMVKEYLQSMRRRSAAHGVDEEMARAYELANPRTMSVDGIARYWKKRARA